MKELFGIIALNTSLVLMMLWTSNPGLPLLVSAVSGGLFYIGCRLILLSIKDEIEKGKER